MTEVLKDSIDKKEVLQETLQNIKNRLDALAQETEEVKQMKGIENDKKAVEAAIFKQKIGDVENMIKEVREQKRGLMEERSRLIRAISQAESDDNESHKRLQQVRAEL